MRKEFTGFPHINNTEDLFETGFYQWLLDNPRDRFTTALEDFLKPLGFCMGDHFLPSNQISCYKAAFSLYHQLN